MAANRFAIKKNFEKKRKGFLYFLIITKYIFKELYIQNVQQQNIYKDFFFIRSVQDIRILIFGDLWRISISWRYFFLIKFN